MVPRHHGSNDKPTTTTEARAPRAASHTRLIAGTSAALLLCSVAALVTGAASPAQAATTTTVNVAPVADAYVASANPTKNFGKSVQLQASKDPAHHKVAFLRFAIPNPAGKKITGAELVVTRDNHHLTGTVYANAVRTATWSETAVTAKTSPVVSTYLDSQLTNSTTSTVSLNLLTIVHAGSTASVALTSNSTTNFASFRSREWGTGAPKLVLTLQTTTPPPVPTPTPTPPTATCVSNPMGIPTSGAYLGATVSGTAGDVPALEAQIGQTLGIHRTYYEASQVASAVTTVKADLAAGRLPWISFKVPYSWADMAAGRGDAWAKDIVAKLAIVGGPVWLAFHHEPEGDGIIQDWKLMQQHLAPIVHAYSNNIAYTVILMTWDLFGDPQFRPDAIWPGSQYVDILGLDMYNDYGTNRNGNPNIPMLDPMKYFSVFGPWAAAHNVPWALAETGYTTAAAGVNPAWLTTEYHDMVSSGGIGLAYFDSSLNSIADWTLDLPSKVSAFSALLRAAPRLCS